MKPTDVKELRRSLGLSQARMAVGAGLRLYRVQNWEQGLCQLTDDEMANLSRFIMRITKFRKAELSRVIGFHSHVSKTGGGQNE